VISIAHCTGRGSGHGTAWLEAFWPLSAHSRVRNVQDIHYEAGGLPEDFTLANMRVLA
jgi:hypothetical protein